MDVQTKQCPMCAETIKLEARVCRFCGARFEVKGTGYCSNCHEMRGADENGRCATCGSELMDMRLESELIPPVAAPTPTRAPSASPAPHKRSAKGCLLGVLLAIAIISIGSAILIPRISIPGIPAATRTPISTVTPLPTYTPRPSRTPTPAPIEVTFDTAGNYPSGRLVILRGQLVMFSSTYCGTECGMLLKNPSNASQKITIFVTVGESRQNTLPNQMRPLPDPFKKEDIQVRLDDGTYAGIGSRIIVTGLICETTDEEVCISDIFKIEAWR